MELPRVRSARLEPSPFKVIAGIEIPSASPVFLSVVVLHVLVALVCVLVGLVVMVATNKGSANHRKLGLTYFWFLAAVFVTATVLSDGPS
jgi:uncharacterized membrane protein YozB (DUF420 family)